MSTNNKRLLEITNLTDTDYFVITCIKSSSAARKHHSILVTPLQRADWSVNSNDDAIDELIEDIAESWAASDALGQNNGFSLTWKIETDEQIIRETVLREYSNSLKRLKDTQVHMQSVKTIHRALLRHGNYGSKFTK